MKARRMRWAVHVVCMGARKSAYRVLVRRSEGRRPLGISRHRWKYNIKMDIQYVRWGSMDWIALAQDRDRWWAVVKVIVNFHKMREFLD